MSQQNYDRALTAHKLYDLFENDKVIGVAHMVQAITITFESGIVVHINSHDPSNRVAGLLVEVVE